MSGGVSDDWKITIIMTINIREKIIEQKVYLGNLYVSKLKMDEKTAKSKFTHDKIKTEKTIVLGATIEEN